MISADEVKGLSTQLGVPLPYIEKDYVMGWLLWGIYTNPRLAQNLVLKGGNCLRKVYFPETRFSDDLDFTAFRLDTERAFHRHLDSICKAVEAASGIVFDTDRTRVEVKPTPDNECRALDGRVYFKGFAGDSSVTMRIKFDVSEYERIVLPLQHHPIIHNYSDADACQTEILTYSLEEVLAEKLRLRQVKNLCDHCGNVSYKDLICESEVELEEPGVFLEHRLYRCTIGGVCS